MPSNLTNCLIDIFIALFNCIISYQLGKVAMRRKVHEEMIKVIKEETKWADGCEDVPIHRVCYREGILYVAERIQAATPPEIFGIRVWKEDEGKQQ